MRELIFTWLLTRPDFARPADCRAGLVGPMRRYLIAHDGKGLAAKTPLPAPAALLIAERAEASDALSEFCARCGRCAEAEIFDCETDVDDAA